MRKRSPTGIRLSFSSKDASFEYAQACDAVSSACGYILGFSVPVYDSEDVFCIARSAKKFVIQQISIDLLLVFLIQKGGSCSGFQYYMLILAISLCIASCIISLHTLYKIWRACRQLKRCLPTLTREEIYNEQ